MANENGKPTQQDIDRLLQIASKKLGISPDKLKTTLSDSKTAQELLNRVGGEKAKQALNNPQVLQDMLKNNPQAKRFYDDLTGGGKNGR
ncbi:MAG: hypothetical protein ABF449_01210 [Ethanoligenens sp.]|uniref:hypothetical protein n=1 Tax=Ethanoligenens sp. TaxID=2099655 RepID=UPI0039E809B7